jgi:hypothetical protein
MRHGNKASSDALEARLDEALALTFPASDPIAVDPPAADEAHRYEESARLQRARRPHAKLGAPAFSRIR